MSLQHDTRSSPPGRRCPRHQLATQRDGTCVLCRASDAPSRIGLWFLASSGVLVIVVLAAWRANSAPDVTATQSAARAAPSGALAASRGAAQTAAHGDTRAEDPSDPAQGHIAAEDQSLLLPTAPVTVGASPAPPRAALDPEPAAADNPHDFDLPSAR